MLESIDLTFPVQRCTALSYLFFPSSSENDAAAWWNFSTLSFLSFLPPFCIIFFFFFFLLFIPETISELFQPPSIAYKSIESCIKQDAWDWFTEQQSENELHFFSFLRPWHTGNCGYSPSWNTQRNKNTKIKLRKEKSMVSSPKEKKSSLSNLNPREDAKKKEKRK